MHSLQHVPARTIARASPNLCRAFSHSKLCQLDPSWNALLNQSSGSKGTPTSEDAASSTADASDDAPGPSTSASGTLLTRMMHRRRQVNPPKDVPEVASTKREPTTSNALRTDRVLATSAAVSAKRRADATTLSETLSREPDDGSLETNEEAMKKAQEDAPRDLEVARSRILVYPQPREPSVQASTSSTSPSSFRPPIHLLPPSEASKVWEARRIHRAAVRDGHTDLTDPAVDPNVTLAERLRAIVNSRTTPLPAEKPPRWPESYSEKPELFDQALITALAHNKTKKKPQPARHVRAAVHRAFTEDVTPGSLRKLFGKKGIKKLKPDQRAVRTIAKLQAEEKRDEWTKVQKEEVKELKGDRARMIEGKLKDLFEPQLRQVPTGDPLSGFTSSWGTDELAPQAPNTAESMDEEDSDVFGLLGSKARAPHIRRAKVDFCSRVDRYLPPPSGDTLLEDLKSPSEHKPIAKLAHGLDRVLFNPGVHWIQDPRSRVYNFLPGIQDIPKVTDFAFERLTGFIRSSSDDDLWKLAKQESRRYAGSTSSLTSFLAHIYFLISGDREVDTSSLTGHFMMEPRTFTPGQRMPASLTLRYRDGVYSLDSGWGPKTEEKTVLTWMGTMLENYLTNDNAAFSRLLRATPRAPEDSGPPMREAYRYSKSTKFVMRSQLDCVDPRLPGTGVFDIKTRAALPIRMDQLNYEENSGYQIQHLTGPMQSFEREYYDLIRAAFLKYSLQVRIGNMDGVFVAYHNTARLFGFQYIPLEEMERALYGGDGRGEMVFKHAVTTMEAVLDEAVKAYPEQTIRVLVETLDGEGRMRVWVQPEAWEGEEAARPITELEVRAEGMIGGQAMPNNQLAINACTTAPWSINLSILRSARHQDELHANKSFSLQRQFRALPLPTGVSFEDAETYWHSIDHGQVRARESADGEGPMEHPPFDPKRVMRPSQDTLSIRRLARQGAKALAKEKQEWEGRAKVVWGEPFVDDAEVEKAAMVDGELGEGGEEGAAGEKETKGEWEMVVGKEESEDAEADAVREEGIEGVTSDDVDAPAQGIESTFEQESDFTLESSDRVPHVGVAMPDPSLATDATRPTSDLGSTDIILEDSLRIFNAQLAELDPVMEATTPPLSTENMDSSDRSPATKVDDGSDAPSTKS